MGCWDIYCCICGNSCVSLHEENEFHEEFRKGINIKEFKDLVKKSKWVKKSTMLLQNNKVVHGCERVGDNVEFEDKNNKKYEAIFNILSFNV